jgi:hypothetical protein
LILLARLAEIPGWFREFFLGEKSQGQFVLVRETWIDAALELTAALARAFRKAV